MLTDPQIQLVVANYEARRGEFIELASHLHKWLSKVLEDHAISKFMVTQRAKQPASLGRMLSLEKNRKKYKFEELMGSISPPINDLAAARVLLYQEPHVGQVVAALESALAALHSSEKKSFNKPDGYRAEHFSLQFGDGEPLCEVQVCTITAHVWNELEHDIIYKQPDGRPNERQQELLESLSGEFVLAEKTVTRLMKRTAENSVRNTEPIRSGGELRHYLERRAGRPVRGNPEALYELVRAYIHPLTPAALDALLEKASMEEAIRLADDLDKLKSEGDVGVCAVRLVSVMDRASLRTQIEEAFEPPPLWRLVKLAIEKLGES